MASAHSYILSLTLLPLFFTVPVYGQSECEYGSVSHIMETGKANVRVSNNGWLFRSVPYESPLFEVPANGGVDAIYQAQAWIGGMIGGELLFTGSAYREHYLPGPLDVNGLTRSDCAEFDTIYSISQEDIQSFQQHTVATQSLLDWPADLGAPVLDGNGNTNDYTLAEGDVPALVGEKAVWWIMNDGGRTDSLFHFDSRHVGLETSVYVSVLDQTPPDVIVTYLKYSFRYVRENALQNAYIGFFVDPLLGDFGDDASVSDTLNDSAITYNVDNEDSMYGTNPPALGVTLLRGPVVNEDGRDNDQDGVLDEPDERLGMSAFIGRSDEPHEFHSYEAGYNHLRGLCRIGIPIREPEIGIPSNPCDRFGTTGTVTSFWYTGDPLSGTGWLKLNGGDETFVISAGPFDWQPGETKEIEYVVTWARSGSNLGSYSRVKSVISGIKDDPSVFEPSVTKTDAPVQSLPRSATLSYAYPNPADEWARIKYDVPSHTHVSIKIFDMLGRIVKTITDEQQSAGSKTQTVDTKALRSGVYVYTVSIGRLSGSQILTVLH